MPRLDGFSATRLIRQSEPPGVRVPIIALTASATTGEEVRCREAGMTGFLTKPVRLDATERCADEWLIGFGAIAGNDTLSASGDLVEAAANLFDALHRADDSDCPAIAVAPVPDEGIGIAINDRLRRAAHR